LRSALTASAISVASSISRFSSSICGHACMGEECRKKRESRSQGVMGCEQQCNSGHVDVDAWVKHQGGEA
jgi:hypothetical protein